MQIPYVSIYITDKGGLGMSHVTSESGAPLEVETPLDFFDGKGFDETIKYLGRVVLGLMASFYPEEMAKHPELHVPYNSRPDIDAIQHLISKSLQAKTKIFIPAIDALVDEVCTRDPMLRTSSDTIDSWPSVREMISARPG